MTSQLISPEYKAAQEHLHATTNYGVASVKYAPLVTQIIDKLEIAHLLDYGCGSKMNLLKHIEPKGKLKYQGYDPAAGDPELASDPVPAQMVACIDVLEHIEPAYLDNVLDHIASLTEAVVFLTVHCGPAGKVLPDGRNAHLIQERPEWWLPKIQQRFEIQTFQMTHADAFYVIGHPRLTIENADGTTGAPKIILPS